MTPNRFSTISKLQKLNSKSKNYPLKNLLEIKVLISSLIKNFKKKKIVSHNYFKPFKF
jgi:hypothetical protein